jgi:hypothetical protein
MSKLQYIGIKAKGVSFRVVNRENFKKELDQLPDGKYRLTVEKYKKNKSNPQLGYLFAVIYPLVLRHLIDAGWEFSTVEEVDIYCKTLFANRDVLNTETAEIISIPALKRDFTTTDMMTYIDAIRKWDAEYLGGMIPEPVVNFELNYQ